MKNKNYLIADFVIGEKIYIKCEPWKLSDAVTQIEKDDIVCYHIGVITKFDGPRIHVNMSYFPKDIILLPITEKEFAKLMSTLKLSDTYTTVEHLGKMSEIFI